MSDVLVGNADTVVYAANLQRALAAFLAGTLVSTMLLGVFIAQCYAYFIRSTIKRNRADVILCWIAIVFTGCCQVATNAHVWSMMVINFGQPRIVLDFVSTPYVLSLAFNAVLQFACQAYFAKRVYLVYDRRPYIGIPLGIFVIAILGCGIGISIRHGLDLNADLPFPIILAHSRKIIQAKNWLTLVLDLIITSSITYKLWTVKKHMHAETEHFVNKILMVALGTAALTTATATVQSVLTLLKGNASYGSITLNMIMPRIFAVSMLFTLNARDDLIRPDDSSYGAKSPTVIRTFNSNFLRSRRETHGFDGAFSDLSPRTGKAPWATTSQGIQIELDVQTRVDTEKDAEAHKSGFVVRDRDHDGESGEAR